MSASTEIRPDANAPSDQSYWQGSVLVLGAAVLWGTSFPATAVALHVSAPLSVALFRGLGQMAALGLALLMLAGLGRGVAWGSISRRGWLAVAALGALGAFFNVGQALSVELGGVVVPSLVAGMYPVAAVATAVVISREPLTRPAAAGIALATGGTVLLADPSVIGSDDLLALVLAALAAVSFGVYIAASRRLLTTQTVPPLAITMAVFVALVVESAAGLVLTGTSALPTHVTSEYLGAIVWLVLACGVAPLVMIELALRRAPVVRTSPYLFVSSVVAAVIGIWAFDERLSWLQIVGAMAAVGGIVVATVAVRPSRR